MRLAGVAMVRNEMDVIESFVRHNLSFLDSLAVVDHGSFDGTSEVLAKLRDEGLPLEVSHDADPAYRQSQTMTRLAREALEGGADFVFALDADEFLKVGSRAEFERALARVPRGMHAAMHWLTYVPDAFDDVLGPGHLWWRLESERHGLVKVIVSRALVEHPADEIAMGNHAVLTGAAGSPQPHARIVQEVAALAHCPVRSRGQLEAKIIVGHLANLASGPSERRLARHWRELYEELRGGGTLTEARLRDIARNYGLPIRNWRRSDEVALVEDPVRLTASRRYPSSPTDPLRLLLRFAERLVAEERARRAQDPAAAGAATLYVAL